MTEINTTSRVQSVLNQLNRQSNLVRSSLNTLSTGRNINLSPGNKIFSSLLKAQIQPLQTAIDNTQSTINFLETADAASQQVGELLADLRSVTVKASNPALSDEEKQTLQSQANLIVDSIDRIQSTTKFGGNNVFSSPFAITDKSDEIGSAQITQTNNRDPFTVSVNVVQAGQRASASGTVSAVQTSDVSFKITGPQGTAEISLAAGATRDQIVDAINERKNETGVEATDSGEIRTVQFGRDAAFSIDFKEGSLDGIEEGFYQGSDIIATVNGVAAQGRGNTAIFNSPSVSGQVTIDENETGSFQFTVAGGGFAVQTGLLPNQSGVIRFQSPSASSAVLGESSNLGSISSLRSGIGNNIINNPSNALSIIDSAINELSEQRGQLGSLRSNLLESNVDNFSNLLSSLTSTNSLIEDADVATEISNLFRHRLLNDVSRNTLGTYLKGNSLNYINFLI